MHQGYLQAGAEIIETNTFGANSFRLGRHSLADKVREVNLAGARPRARGRQELRCLGCRFGWPAGDSNRTIGQNFVRRSARSVSSSRSRRLPKAAVDLLILETFGTVEELHQAMLAARDVNPKLPRGCIGDGGRRFQLP